MQSYYVPLMPGNGCVICFNPTSLTMRQFPCGCSLPIHDACIPIWRNGVTRRQCPSCQQVWNVQPILDIQPPLPPYLHLRYCCVCICSLIILGLLIWLGVFLFGRLSSA